MKTNPKDQTSKKKGTSNAKKAATPKRSRVVKPDDKKALPHQPGISPSAVDVTGIIPEDVHVDPNLTEGHPGYEESGGSEIIPG
jgi:hypothetical protein